MIKKNEESLILRLQNIPIQNVMKIISFPFNFEIFFITVSIFIFIRVITKKDLIFIALGQAILVVFKFTFRRTRPFNNNLFINNLTNKNYRNTSFPSGHSFLASLFCTLLLENKKIKNNRILSTIIRLTPYLVAASRVYLGVHYPSDVLGGLLLGYLYNKLFRKKFKKINFKKIFKKKKKNN
jgi:undecaprenyl-diphosphatase